MLSTSLGVWVAFVYLLFASALAVGIGALACLVLRQSWGSKVAITDAAVAAVVAVVAAYIVAAIEASRGVWASTGMLVLAIALGSVVLKHLLQFAFRSVH